MLYRLHSSESVSFPAGLCPRGSAQLWPHPHCSHATWMWSSATCRLTPTKYKSIGSGFSITAQGGRHGWSCKGMVAHSHWLLHSGRRKVRPLRILQKVSQATCLIHAPPAGFFSTLGHFRYISLIVDHEYIRFLHAGRMLTWRDPRTGCKIPDASVSWLALLLQSSLLTLAFCPWEAVKVMI